MTKRVEMNAGETFEVSDKVILVREQESVIAMASKLGTTENDQVTYMMTFKGKLNNKERSGDVTIMMSLEDAMQHAMTIIEGIEWFIKTVSQAKEVVDEQVH